MGTRWELLGRTEYTHKSEIMIHVESVPNDLYIFYAPVYELAKQLRVSHGFLSAHFSTNDPNGVTYQNEAWDIGSRAGDHFVPEAPSGRRVQRSLNSNM